MKQILIGLLKKNRKLSSINTGNEKRLWKLYDYVEVSTQKIILPCFCSNNTSNNNKKKPSSDWCKENWGIVSFIGKINSLPSSAQTVKVNRHLAEFFTTL